MATWKILNVKRCPGYYKYQVEGINEHALGTINERFYWSVPSLSDGYSISPDASPESQAIFEASQHA